MNQRSLGWIGGLVVLDQLIVWMLLRQWPQLLTEQTSLLVPLGGCVRTGVTILLVLVVWSMRRPIWVPILITAGALSNLITQALYGTFIDYLPLFGISHINVADLFISAGVVLNAVHIFRQPKTLPAEAKSV